MYNIQDTMKKITSENFERNKRIITREFGSLNYIDKDNNSLYHLFITAYSPFGCKSYAIDTLLNFNIDPNAKNKNGDTFIHYALKNAVDMRDITIALSDAKICGFDVNAKNDVGYTVLHDALIYVRGVEELTKFIYALYNVDFDFNATDSRGDDFISFVQKRDHFTELSKSILCQMITTHGKEYEKLRCGITDGIIPVKKVDFKFGEVLNYKYYKKEPAIGRDDEVRKLIVSLATDKKLPLLIGPSGVGKTAIADELAYRIVNGNVPDSLKDKLICEVYLSSILSDTHYRGDFEHNMQELLQFAKKNKAIFFFDEIHSIYGAGASEKDNTDAASILKTYIDRCNLSLFGATTKVEYDQYMAHDALKRRFEIIKVDELDNTRLYDVICKEFGYLAEEKKIDICDMIKDNYDAIIKILIELTKDINRNLNDKIYNPDLVISLIDRAFAYAEVDNEHLLELKHLILGIEDNERLKESARNNAICILNNIVPNKSTLVKSRIIDINSYKKEHVLV